MASDLVKLIVKYAINHRGLREEHARRLFFMAARRFTPTLEASVGRSRYFVSTFDRFIGMDVFARGEHDLHFTRAVFDALAACGCTGFAGTTFLDVGANIGVSTIPALRDFGFGRAVAFEPDPMNFELLQHNLLANCLQDRVQTLNVALSDRETTAILERSADNYGDHRIRAGAPEDGTSTGESIPVRTMTLDRCVEEGIVNLAATGLVWIDAQGHEGHILRGATRLTASPIPVCAEYWPPGLNEAGGLSLLEEVIRAWYTHFVDVRAGLKRGRFEACPAEEVESLRQVYPGADEYTDLLLLKLPPGREECR